MNPNAWLADICEIIPYKTLDEWHQIRAGGNGGSDIATIFGFSIPYQSLYSLWAVKTGVTPPEEAGEEAYWGTKLEDTVAQEFAERSGMALMEWKVTLRSKIYPNAQANVDRFIVKPSEKFPAGKSTLWDSPKLPPCEILCLYEGKTAGKHVDHKWDDDAIPMGYQLQGQWYMLVTGLKVVHYGCLLSGQHFVTRVMEFDENLVADLVDTHLWFWDLVQTGVAPPVDDSEATERALKAQYAEVEEGSRVEAGDELRGLLEDLKDTKDEVKRWEAKKRLISNEIRDLLGPNEAGTVNGKIAVTLKSTPSSGLDQEKLAAEYPEAFQACRTRSSYRRLLPVKGAI